MQALYRWSLVIGCAILAGVPGDWHPAWSSRPAGVVLSPARRGLLPALRGPPSRPGGVVLLPGRHSPPARRIAFLPGLRGPPSRPAAWSSFPACVALPPGRRSPPARRGPPSRPGGVGLPPGRHSPPARRIALPPARRSYRLTINIG